VAGRIRHVRGLPQREFPRETPHPGGVCERDPRNPLVK
jgi:hypothetical protein